MKTAAGSSESLLAPTALGGVLARRGMRFQGLWLLQRVDAFCDERRRAVSGIVP